MVAIGVRGLGEHLGGHHVVEGLAHGVDRLDLGAGTDIFVRKGLGILRNIDHGLEPVVRNSHLITPYEKEMPARTGDLELI